MAYWNRKGKFGKVYVYSYYVDGQYQKKPKPLPREQTNHLDPLEDLQVQQWVDQWELRWEKNDKFQPTRILYSDDLITAYLEKYKAHLLKYRSESTALNRVSIIRRYAVPYFLSQNPPMKDPQLWVSVSIKLLEHLERQSLSWSLMAAINTDLRGFYRYLIEEGIVQHGRELPLRFPKKSEEDAATTLEFDLTPEAMLTFIAKQKDWRVKLMGLLGYFFSLRPQETFGIKRSDFISKSDLIANMDCTRRMSRAKLFDKFVVYVDRQRTNKGKLIAPKMGSRGHVACWNSEAAKQVVQIIKELESEVLVFKNQNRHLYDLWDTAALGLTLKDLRRASLRNLGFETDMGDAPLHLKDHARHNDFKTTLLYLRPPAQTSSDISDDLDTSNW